VRGHGPRVLGVRWSPSEEPISPSPNAESAGGPATPDSTMCPTYLRASPQCRTPAAAIRLHHARWPALARSGRAAAIRALAIPPAWHGGVDLELAARPHPGGGARETLAAASQYRYPRGWREVRERIQVDGQLVAFGDSLPAIRKRVDETWRARAPREKVLATVVHLRKPRWRGIATPNTRAPNRSFALTTLRDRHVDVRGAPVEFQSRERAVSRTPCW